ncbi:hypothetical protein [Bacillus sp. FJAT-45350]|uniref:hypothetical protein n=1 Tax=Bacillus sp. FJAT-45350 TaxID=2011014 RepID=UPI000BB71045|nr:hypothetical protein [Bacillus sp. FJAT-45350]
MAKTSVRLKKPQDVRRLLQRVINELLNDEPYMTTEKARVIATLSNSVLKSMEMSDLQEEMEKLKEVVERMEGEKI